MEEVAIYGVGQLGSLLAQGAMRAGYRVTPVLRDTDLFKLWTRLEEDAPILMAVGERELWEAGSTVPVDRHEQVILMQNELFPASWEEIGLEDPTVLVFWSNKKAGKPLQRGFRSGIYGHHGALLREIHDELGVAYHVLESRKELLEELVAKYSFILTINTLGLIDNVSIGSWAARDMGTVRALIDDAARLGQAQAGIDEIDITSVANKVLSAFRALPDLNGRGRTAERRLERARTSAARLGIELPAFDDLGLPAFGE